LRLKKITLQNFRNYKELVLDCGNEDGISFIYGDNAQGKTNLLEAIYILALTKSFRTNKNHDLIKWGEDYSRIKGVIDTKEGDIELEVFYGHPPQPLKATKVNNVKVANANFIGNCNIVFFHPEDLNMLYLGPDLRRRYLDIMNIQIDRRYYSVLKKYKNILEQRNSLLKKINIGYSQKKDLEVWDDQLAESAQYLIETRVKVTEKLNQTINNYYQEIAQTNDQIAALYQKSFENDSFKAALKDNLEKDLGAQFTTVGPHREDIVFTLNKKQLQQHASRGEYRSIMLALKLFEISYYQEKSGETPILLLDDVLSELDEKRSKMLFNTINNGQVFVTGTHLARKHRSIMTFKVNSGTLAKMAD
jgi:DNA replication and repair protein RecF